MSSLCVRHYSKVYVSSFKFELDESKIRFDWSKITEIRFCRIFKQGPSPIKRLEFQSNLSTYKRETLTTFWRPLEDLCVILSEIWEVLYLLTTQISTKLDQSKIRFDWSKITEIRFCRIFKQGPSPLKRLEFQSNLSTYKRETLTTFWRPLEDLCVTLCEIWKVLYLLTTQMSTGARSTIKHW